jgi:predicted amidohydrolase
MKIAAYQAPLPLPSWQSAIELISSQVRRCETEGVSILCCPEAVLGGLADDTDRPREFALSVSDGSLARALAPLASSSVTTIIGFTELGDDGRLYNSAAVLQRGAIASVYRKQRPAIHHSVYAPGNATLLFHVAERNCGILICNDSNFPELIQSLAAQHVTLLFIPSNNALRPARARMKLVTHTRQVDNAIAITHRLWVVRADVAGETANLLSFGTSEIVRPDGSVAQLAALLREDLLVVDTKVESSAEAPSRPLPRRTNVDGI